MKKELTLPACSCRHAFFLFLIIFFSVRSLIAQPPANNNGHLFRITTGLKSPIRIAIDNQDGVYVTDAFQKCISKYNSSGNYIGSITPGGLPISVSISNDNQLVVSDNINGNILKLKTNGDANTIYKACAYPSDAAFDSNNKLYVVDSKQKQIIVMDLSGNVIKTIGDDVLVFPTGIAYDRKNNRILVAEHGGTKSKTGQELEAKILIFDVQGNLISTFGEFGYEDGQFTRIQGLAVDNWGRIYIVDNYQATVSVFSENGDFITKFGEFGNDPGQLSAPMDIAVDSRNRIWITSMNTGSVEVFGMKGIGLEVDSEMSPGTVDLLQNYPNPFREGTWIPFVLSVDGELTLNIFNINGTLVRTIQAGFFEKGNYQDNERALFWDGNAFDGQPVGKGIYFYELKLNDTRKVGRMILLK